MSADVNLARVDVRRTALFAISLGIAGLSGCAPRSGPAPAQTLAEHIPAALRASANHGREILRPDGFLALPKGVRRVWVDVGAHHLETTRGELRYPDVAVIAIEPLKEAWATWPDSDRVIGIPVAIYLEHGTMDFHVNALDDTSFAAREHGRRSNRDADEDRGGAQGPGHPARGCSERGARGNRHRLREDGRSGRRPAGSSVRG